MSAPGPQTLIRSQRSRRTGSARRLPTPPPKNNKDANMTTEQIKFEFKKKKPWQIKAPRSASATGASACAATCGHAGCVCVFSHGVWKIKELTLKMTSNISAIGQTTINNRQQTLVQPPIRDHGDNRVWHFRPVFVGVVCVGLRINLKKGGVFDCSCCCCCVGVDQPQPFTSRGCSGCKMRITNAPPQPLQTRHLSEWRTDWPAHDFT